MFSKPIRARVLGTQDTIIYIYIYLVPPLNLEGKAKPETKKREDKRNSTRSRDRGKQKAVKRDLQLSKEQEGDKREVVRE